MSYRKVKKGREKIRQIYLFISASRKLRQAKKKKKFASLWKKNKQKQLKLNPLFQITQKVQFLTLTIPYSMYSPQGKVTIFSWVGAGKLTDQPLQRNESVVVHSTMALIAIHCRSESTLASLNGKYSILDHYLISGNIIWTLNSKFSFYWSITAFCLH